MKEPGIYPDISIDAYHASEGISSTGISLMLDCPARYFHKYVTQPMMGVKQDTHAMLMGRALHMLVLEKELFNKNFYVMPYSVNLKTTAGKNAYKLAEFEAGERIVLRKEAFDEIDQMAQAILENPIWKGMLPGKVEHSVFWDAGLYKTRLRSRPDFYNDKVIIDIKTTNSVKSFATSVYKFGYHRQAAMQIDGLYHFDKVKRFFAFIAVESKAPYLTGCFVLNDESIMQGRREYLGAAEKYFECTRTGQWPGYEEKYFQEISIPTWAMASGE